MAQTTQTAEWSGYPDPADPDNFWIDDATGERVSAHSGVRIPAEFPVSDRDAFSHWTLAMHMQAEGEL
jgi:hypothetical protein